MPLLHRYLAAVVVLTASCATTNPRGAEGTVASSRNPDIIVLQELRDPAIASMDALTAIRQLRPAFFRNRGPQTMRNSGNPELAPGVVRVSQDFGPLQAVSALSAISTRTIVEVRYLNANEATGRFGINANGSAVIVVLSAIQ